MVWLNKERNNYYDFLFTYLFTIKKKLFFYFLLDVWEMLESNKFDQVSTLLDGHPNIINSMRRGEDELTLMMHAATKHRKDCVEFLSKKPHDLSVVSKDGLNILHHICNAAKDEVALDMLMSLDQQQINKDLVNKQTDVKQTALHYAARWNRHTLVGWLAEHGADRSLKNMFGKRAEDHDNCDEETKRLIKHGKK